MLWGLGQHAQHTLLTPKTTQDTGRSAQSSCLTSHTWWLQSENKEPVLAVFMTLSVCTCTGDTTTHARLGQSWVSWSELVTVGCMNLNMLLRAGEPQFPQLKARTVGVLTDSCKNHTHTAFLWGISSGWTLLSCQVKALPGPWAPSWNLVSQLSARKLKQQPRCSLCMSAGDTCNQQGQQLEAEINCTLQSTR